MVEEGVIKILSTQESVSVGWLDFEDALLDLEDGDIKSSAAKIKDGNTERDEGEERKIRLKNVASVLNIINLKNVEAQSHCKGLGEL